MFYRCPACSELFASDRRPFCRCTACGALLRVSPVELARDIGTPLAPFESIVWESGQGRLLSRYVVTLRQLVSHAPQFFFTLGVDDQASAKRAEAFAYFSCMLGFFGFFATQLWLYGRDPAETSKLAAIVAEATGRSIRPDGIAELLTLGFACSPLLALFPMHVTAGLYHLALRLLTQQARSYELTFRVAAYGLAPAVLFAVPPLGPLLAPGWILALHWVGLATAHRLPLGLSLLTMLLPWATGLVFFMKFIGHLLVLALTVPG